MLYMVSSNSFTEFHNWRQHVQELVLVFHSFLCGFQALCLPDPSLDFTSYELQWLYLLVYTDVFMCGITVPLVREVVIRAPA